MQTRADMENELRTRLKVAANSTVYTAARLTELIKAAHLWATSYYIWDELVRARVTGTKNGANYCDYPDDFRANTIVRLRVDGVKYDRKSFDSFEEFTSNNPTADNVHIFANYGRQYFIFPTPTSDGTRNINIWGAIQANDLGSSITKTIFSTSNEEGNEAIVEKAYSVAKGDKGHEDKARMILDTIQEKRADSTQLDQVDKPMFNVPDFFGNSPGFTPGNSNKL